MNKRHGKSNTRIYHIWAGMKQRCSNIHATDYILYGGRGYLYAMIGKTLCLFIIGL